MLLIANFTFIGGSGVEFNTTFHRIILWPFTWEFFIEMLLAIEASWLILNDMMNGTYKNVVSAGISRRRYFLSQMLCVIVTVTLELILAALFYIRLMYDKIGLYDITSEQWKMYIFYLILIGIRHLTIVILCASISFMVRKIRVMITSVLVVFSVMFLDAIASVRSDLKVLVAVMDYMPHATAKLLRDQIFMGNIPIVKSMINSIPTIMIAVVIASIAMIVFEKADLNN